MTTGYSGTPLAKKLGLRDGMLVHFIGMPESVRKEIDAFNVSLTEPCSAPYDAVHIFTKQRDRLRDHLATARHEVREDGMVWVSWPKKASKVPTDISEDTIRGLALPMGFVDNKVCAVDPVWSALKLVIRRELRSEANRR